MRISIREQLGLLVLFCALTSLAVLALAVVCLLVHVKLHAKPHLIVLMVHSGFKTILSSETSACRASL